MGEVFCYLLGAGARANALSVVDKIPERLKDFAARVKEWTDLGATRGRNLAEAAEQLLGGIEGHAAIDTNARKLFLRGSDRDLKDLKALTSCFFVSEQARLAVDYRYNSFLASVLVRGPHGALVLPANLRFVMWSYDTQMEKAVFGFCDNEDETM